jgi:hypothetical protein
MKNYELELKGEKLQNLLTFLETVPYKYASPIVNLISENIKEVKNDEQSQGFE